MMQKILHLIVIMGIVFATVLTIRVGLREGDSNGFSNNLSQAQGTVVAMESGLLVISFDKPVVNTCGDTNIHTFALTPSGFNVQLKSIFIPEVKAMAINDQQGSSLVFPIWDVMAFLQEPGVYTIELFVANNCSRFNNETISLPPVELEISTGDKINEGKTYNDNFVSVDDFEWVLHRY